MATDGAAEVVSLDDHRDRYRAQRPEPPQIAAENRRAARRGLRKARRALREAKGSRRGE